MKKHREIYCRKVCDNKCIEDSLFMFVVVATITLSVGIANLIRDILLDFPSNIIMSALDIGVPVILSTGFYLLAKKLFCCCEECVEK